MLRIIFFPITATYKVTVWTCKATYKFTKWLFKEAIKETILGFFGL